MSTPSLSSLLSKAKVADSPIKAITVEIDAPTAEILLEHFNNTNRPVRKGTIKGYTNLMLRGKWKLNGEPLIFGVDDEGNDHLISGQHRLLALVEATKQYTKNPEAFPDASLTIHTVAITGVSLDTADTVDSGETRKHADVLFRDEWVDTVIAKEWNNNASRRRKWVTTLAGAARLVWLRSGGATVSSATKFDISEMLDFIKIDHVALCSFVSDILSASEEEGKGLRMSLPYIAALAYIACLDESGTVVKSSATTILDAMLRIAQSSNIVAGTAEHALVSYWNQLSATPGSKDRDLEIVGPFIKAVKAILDGEKITAAKLKLTKKEVEAYKTAPPLFNGWDENSFIIAAEKRAAFIESVQQMKEEAAKAKEVAQAEKEAAKEKAKAEKEAEKEKAKVEAEAAKTKIANSGIMAAAKKKAPAGIKRKPVAA